MSVLYPVLLYLEVLMESSSYDDVEKEDVLWLSWVLLRAVAAPWSTLVRKSSAFPANSVNQDILLHLWEKQASR